MPSQFQNFASKLGITNPKRKGTGFNFAPFTVEQGESTPGQTLFEKIGERKGAGSEIYNQNKSEITTRLGKDLVDKSTGTVPTDEFGRPEQNLTNFQSLFENQLKANTQRGNLAWQTAEAKNAWQNAKNMQDIGSYGFSGMGPGGGSNGTDIPGAKGNNPGAKAVSLAMRAVKNGTPYVWGGNSLSRGVDCSGLIQQIYRQMGVNVPRTTYQQAKHGKRVSLNSIRPGDLVFFNNLGHVGIYVGNGKYAHAANSRLGTITSSLMNSSNGRPEAVVRPY